MLPVLFLPGLLCDGRLFQPQIAAVEAAGGTALVGPTTQDDSMVAIARRVLAMAPPRFALAGLSMGGYVALEVLRQAGHRVAGVALLDTQARPDDAETLRRRAALIDISKRGQFKGVTPRLLPMLIHKDRLQDAALTGLIMAMAEEVGQPAFVRQQTAIMGRVDSRPDLPGLRLPTLIVTGAEDEITPPDRAAEMASAIPGAQLHILPHCGHLATLEKPQESTELLMRFVASL